MDLFELVPWYFNILTRSYEKLKTKLVRISRINDIYLISKDCSFTEIGAIIEVMIYSRAPLTVQDG